MDVMHDGSISFRIGWLIYIFHSNGIEVRVPDVDDELIWDVFWLQFREKSIVLSGVEKNSVVYKGAGATIWYRLDGARLKETVELERAVDLSMVITSEKSSKPSLEAKGKPSKALHHKQAGMGYGKLAFREANNGVKITLKDGVVGAEIPDGVVYPFRYDPTIEASSYSLNVVKNGMVRTSGGRIYTVGLDSSYHLALYYSDNDGTTWTKKDSGAVMNSPYVSLTMDSSGDIWLVGKDSSGIAYIKYVVSTGLFGSLSHTGSSAYDQPACACGPNGVLQIVYQYSANIYHWDSVNGTTLISAGAGAYSIHSTIYVDSSNNAHIASGDGTSNRNELWKYFYHPYGGSVTEHLIESSSGTANVYYNSAITVDSTGRIYVACQDPLNAVSGTKNIRLARSDDSGSSWSIENVTSLSTNQYSPQLGLDQDDKLLVVWHTTGRGSYTSRYQVVYRTRTHSGTWSPLLSSASSLLTDTNADHKWPYSLPFAGNGVLAEVGAPICYTDTTNTDIVYDGTTVTTWKTVSSTPTDDIVRTALWRISTEPSVEGELDINRAWQKPAIRLYAGDTGEFAGGTSISYGPSGEVSVGIHFRLEDFYGGHATTRRIFHKWDGVYGGWKIEYDVANTNVKVTLSDGSTIITASGSIDAETLDWWIFTFIPGGSLKLYRGNTLLATTDASAMGSVNNSQKCGLGDTTSTIAMLFGGAFLASAELNAGDIDNIVTKKDSVWDSLVSSLEFHVPGQMHDWGGSIGRDVDESSNQWKDVQNSYNLNMTFIGANTKGMERQIVRPSHVYDGGIISLEFSRRGASGQVSVGEDDDVDVGDAICLNGYKKWMGKVTKIKRGLGGKILQLRGMDEDVANPYISEQFTDRQGMAKDRAQLDTDLLPESTGGSGESGTAYSYRNTKDQIMADAMASGHGWRDGYMGFYHGEGTTYTLAEGDFALIDREESTKDSVSEVTLTGYGNSDIPYEQTGMASGSTVYSLTKKPVQVIYVKVSGTEVFTGYHVDGDNQELIFDATTTGTVDIKYTYRDIKIASVRDKDIEEEIGKESKVDISVGYIGTADLTTLATSLLRGKYWIVTIRPRTAKYYAYRWYPGERIVINVTGDVLAINGDYFITKVLYEGSLSTAPTLMLEQYDATLGVPNLGRASSLPDVMSSMKTGLQKTNYGHT